jgi:hypothetical protein
LKINHRLKVMENLHENDHATFPTPPKLQIRPSFFIENGKYYEQIRRTFDVNEGNVRLVEYVQWIEKLFPTWISEH